MTINQFTGEHEFLSNFHREADGKTAEHRFQAAKTTDPDEAARVMACATPAQAKRAGRKVTLRRRWNEERVAVMREVLRAKFAPGTELATKLLATGHEHLTEGNTWHDQFWGDCQCGQSRCARRGRNELGMLLMEIRDELRFAD